MAGAGGRLQEHLAALSPYFPIYRQPRKPAAGKVSRAVYLFRHGNLEVSRHDYVAIMQPFLAKLARLQQSSAAGRPFVRGRLAPLSRYRSWITQAHVGMVSTDGLRQSCLLGRHFRVRYSRWLREAAAACELDESGKEKGMALAPLLTVWSDGATRCRLSAIAFTSAFSGQIVHGTEAVDDDLPQIDCQVRIVEADQHPGTCAGLSWHESLGIDQQAGGQQMRRLMETTAREALVRLRGDWLEPGTFGVEDIYALQLLHCYDVISGRRSPVEDCFTQSDWHAFEYLRDTKYHFSEGHAARSGRYAVPWMVAVMRKLGRADVSPGSGHFPLDVAFTHREEVLYLCCLLGIGSKEGWTPDLDRVDMDRQWRVSQLAPYLGHVGIESYHQRGGEKRLRVIVNGSIVSAFGGQLQEDADGGYDFDAVREWVSSKPYHWAGFEGL